ncbi:MAG: OmpH family outer membrane protein [Pseudomonadota bacterium]
MNSTSSRFLKSVAWTLSAICLVATSPVIAADFKVGFVDVSRILEVAPQADAARKRIEKEFSPKDRQLISQQKEIRRSEDRLIRERDVMAAADRVKLERKIRGMKRDVRRQQEEFREDLNIRRNQELGKLQRKVILTIRDLAKAENYDLIISDGVLFAGSRVDITDKVLAKLKSGR